MASFARSLHATGNVRCEAEQHTWTFVGHWDEGTIVVEYVIDGEVPDERIDTGYWPQGLWAASGTGCDLEETQARVIAEYERQA